MDYTVNLQSETIDPIPSLPFTALGGQPEFDRAALDEFLAGNHIANLSYVRKDGRPNQAPLWYRYEDGVMVFAIATGSAKHRALLRDDRVCVTVQDERPPYRAAIIDGTVELVDIGTDGALSAELATRYFGKLGANEYAKLSSADREATGQTVVRLIPSEVKGFRQHPGDQQGAAHLRPCPRPATGPPPLDLTVALCVRHAAQRGSSG